MSEINQKLSKITVSLHWIIALAIIGLMAVGWYMDNFKAFGLYYWHKSFGVLIFVFIVARVAWRLKKGFPEPISVTDKMQMLAAKVVHWVLLVGTLLFPISGMMMSGAGGRGIFLFNIELLAENKDAVTGKAVALNETIAGIGAEVHGLLFWVFVISLALHIGGALKHHLIDKDRTLLRMLNK